MIGKREVTFFGRVGEGGGCSFCVKDKLNSEIFNDLGGVDTLMHTMTNRHSHRQHF